MSQVLFPIPKSFSFTVLLPSTRHKEQKKVVFREQGIVKLPAYVIPHIVRM